MLGIHEAKGGSIDDLKWQEKVYKQFLIQKSEQRRRFIRHLLMKHKAKAVASEYGHMQRIHPASNPDIYHLNLSFLYLYRVYNLGIA